MALCDANGPRGPATLDPDSSNPTILKSILFYTDRNTAYFGSEAIRRYTDNDFQGRLIRSVKKFLPDIKFQGTEIDGKIYTLEEIIGSFLRELKSRAEAQYQIEIDQVVLGRPARFSQDQELDEIAETRLLKSALSAGFKDISFFPEPLAAAHSYRKKIQQPKTILIADLGGGTSDFTIINLDPLKYSSSDVLSIHGVAVAGDAIDGALMRNQVAPYFGSEIKYQLPMSSNILEMPPTLKYRLSSPAEMSLLTGSETERFLKSLINTGLSADDRRKLDRLFVLTEDNLGYRVFSLIEKLKIDLCEKQQAVFDFDYPEIELNFESGYSDLINAANSELDQILSAVNETLNLAQLKPEQIDLVVCTGGTSFIPHIHQQLQLIFGKEKIDSFENFHSVIGGLSARAMEILTE